jgi:hypothetical protein|tara:strand:- start:464 stop:853 length:390 start_codon:yes stop_codon:yes gene_type:complete
MVKEHNVGVADLYALREYLTRHYGGNYQNFSLPNQVRTRELFGGDRYLFTHVNKEHSTHKFHLRRVKFFRQHDLVDFSLSGNYMVGYEIRVLKGDIRDKSDKEQVNGLVDLLSERCYNSMIPNLDDLKA